jgi:hypothetical protein
LIASSAAATVFRSSLSGGIFSFTFCQSARAVLKSPRCAA